MTFQERNNVLCDAEARKLSLTHPSPELYTQRPPGIIAALRSQQGVVLENINHHLSTFLYLDYAQHFLRLTPDILWKIKWTLHHRIL